MSSRQSPVSRFRTILQNTKDAARTRLAINVLNTLLQDFDRIFFTSPKHAIFNKLIDKYCNKNELLCPICGSKTIERKGKHGVFLGCQKFPNCKGSRRIDGTPSLNDTMIRFLTNKEIEEKEKEKESKNRFARLEL